MFELSGDTGVYGVVSRIVRARCEFVHESLDAAVVHDRLYQIGAVPREQADRAFRQLLRRGGVGPIRAWLMWVAVRWFGGRFYGRTR